MTAPAQIRAQAEALSGALPPLLAEAEHLARAILMGTHGRRLAGRGDEFWQYRTAHAADEARMIDWRRSARSDGHFVRQKEWQAAQTVWVWADGGRSMQFSSQRGTPTKAYRASLYTMALSILLVRGGERVGLLGGAELPASSGNRQIDRIAYQLCANAAGTEHESPDMRMATAHGRVALVSDFMSDPGPLTAQIQKAAQRGIRGVLLQVLDPQEEQFPFRGRTVFQSIGKTLEHETQKARDIRAAYLDRLADRRAQLQAATREAGWHFHHVRTDEQPLPGLLWAYRAIGPQK